MEKNRINNLLKSPLLKTCLKTAKAEKGIFEKQQTSGSSTLNPQCYINDATSPTLKENKSFHFKNNNSPSIKDLYKSVQENKTQDQGRKKKQDPLKKRLKIKEGSKELQSETNTLSRKKEIGFKGVEKKFEKSVGKLMKKLRKNLKNQVGKFAEKKRAKLGKTIKTNSDYEEMNDSFGEYKNAQNEMIENLRRENFKLKLSNDRLNERKKKQKSTLADYILRYDSLKNCTNPLCELKLKTLELKLQVLSEECQNLVSSKYKDNCIKCKADIKGYIYVEL